MYRDVTMFELKEVLRLWGEVCPRSGSPPSSGSIRKPMAATSRYRLIADVPLRNSLHNLVR
jgi:hypothetical protein